METSERTERAVAFKHNKNNCAQAVLLAFSEEMQLPEETLRALGAAFGSGMGGMKATCGALTGAAAVLGKIYAGEKLPKMVMKDIVNEFEQQAGATICGTLKGVGTGKVLCSCDDCIRCAVRLLEKKLAEA